MNPDQEGSAEEEKIQNTSTKPIAESETKIFVSEDDTDKESWTEDGRVHCVEESPDTIRCHSHDEVADDKPMHVRPKQYKKVKDEVSRAVKKAGGKLDIKQKSLDHSASNSGDETKSTVKLEHSEGTVKFINALTGERRSIENLGEKDDVDVDSLMSVRKIRKVKKVNKSSKLQTLHTLIQDLRAENFSKVDIEENGDKHELWPNDEFCAG